MQGKSYKYKEFFPDFDKGVKGSIKLVKQLNGLIKQSQNVKSTGAGLKKTNQLYNESAKIQTEILKIGKLQKQKIKEVNAERRKELNLNKRNKEALNLKLQTEKQELAIKKRLITNQAKLNAQKRLGVRANKGLMGSINNLITRLGVLAAAYLGMQTIRKSIELFKIQEQAVADNEVVFGEFSKTLQKYAADVQKVTTIGDEQTLALTTQAKNFGVAVEDVQEATSGTIGLAEKFKKAGLGQETALKGIALAYQGNFSQLERYIPALRNAETEAEKMTILQNEMAVGFNLAKEAAKTQTGQLEQMSNEFGDIQEEIGEGLIPILVELSKFLLKAIKGFKVMATLARNIFLSQKEGAERNVEILKDDLKGQTDRLKLLRINQRISKNEIELNEQINASNPYSGVIWSKTKEEYLEWAKTRTKNIKLLKAENVLLRDLTNTSLDFGESLEDVNIDLDDNTTALTNNTIATEKNIETKKLYNLELEKANIGTERFAATLAETAEKLTTDAAGKQGISTLEKLFGTDADLKTVQKRYQVLSATASNFIDALDNSKDRSLKKDKRRKQVQKGLDITSAIINTAVAVTGVIRDQAGGVFARVLAGIAIGLFGASQVAKIASSNYYKGTEYLEFGNYKKGRDTIPFMGADGSINMLNGGERIVDTKTNNQLDGFPNPMLPTAVNYYKNAIGFKNNNRNVERLLSEQNGILRNSKQVIQSGNALLVIKDGRPTGEKYYINV